MKNLILLSSLIIVTSNVYAVSFIGINTASCQYNTVSSAILDAQSGDTIYIMPGTYNELLGTIDKGLTLVPAQNSCQQELLTATSASVIIDGNGGSANVVGGMVKITNGAKVTFRHMWLRDTVANDFGGVIAILDGSFLALDDVLVTDGVTNGDGGNIALFAHSSTNSPSKLILINDSSVYRGEATTGNGGSIALFDSELSIEDGNIGVSSNNGFSTAGNNGGGIYAEDSVVSLNSNESKVLYNQSGNQGGGIYAKDSSVTISGGLINENQTTFSGGGIYLTNTPLSMNNASMINNSTNQQQANAGGGAIFLNNNNATIENSSFSGNFSSNSGGAITASSNSSNLIIISSSINNNMSNSGGGLMVWNDLILSNSTVSDNSANRGGGIYCFVCSEININNSDLVNNTATSGSGGGLYIFNNSNVSVDINNSLFELNTAISTLAGNGLGGGIYQSGGVLDIANSNFRQNTASFSGGGIYATVSGNADLQNVVINNVDFEGNQTTNHATNMGGGGMYIEFPDILTIQDSTFNNNEAATLGGGLLIRSSDLVSISETMINQNLAKSGGGLHTSSANLNLKNVTIDNNISTSSGAGMSLTFSSVELINSTISNNNSSSNGGGLHLTGSDISFVSDVGVNAGECNPFALASDRYCSEVFGNTADQQGGGIYYDDILSLSNELNLSGVAFQDNNALVAGSALYLKSVTNTATPDSVTIHNALFANNGNALDETTVIEATGVLELSLSSVTLADNFGIPLRVNDNVSSLEMSNSIVQQNSMGPFLSNSTPYIGSCNSSQSKVSGQSLGLNLGNPLFVTTSRGDYRLSAASTSVDACVNGLFQDIDGLYRPDVSGGMYDQGAFELNGMIAPPELVFSDGFE